MKDKFIEALETSNLSALREIPKSDLHNHADLGGSFSNFERAVGKSIMQPPNLFDSFSDFQNYITEVLDPHLSDFGGANLAKKCTIEQAKLDGVSILEISIHNGFDFLYKGKENEFMHFLSETQSIIHPNLFLIPSLGFKRSDSIDEIQDILKCNIDSGFFKSIDLYGNEIGDKTDKYRNIFRYAKSKGLRLRAHVGEFGNADTVKEAVETLELDEVQHGIAAARSKSVMNFLADNNIRLNICPTSNIKLRASESYASHPIRALFDSGVPVTINTDDMLIFNQSVSEEYLNLFKAGLFAANELNMIRENGLKE